MYLDYFGLEERPFTITPDPRYLFMSERHAEALAHLIYGVTESDGFIVLTGEVGTGKTTLVRSLLQKMPPEADVALVLNPELNAIEFLNAILSELGIEPPADTTSSLSLTQALNQYLLDAHARGRRTIAVVDEAQNLSAEVLEQIRLLTNLETTRHKLLQIVLIGQPELRELLARSDLRQLAQRVTARYHLLPLTAAEAGDYLSHRLAVAGALRPILTKAAKKRIHELAGGVPRLMNLIADRALLGAWSREQAEVDRRIVDAAAIEVFGQPAKKAIRSRRWSTGLTVAAAVAMVVVTLAMVWRQTREAATPPARVAMPIERRIPAEAISTPEPGSAAKVEGTPDLGQWLIGQRAVTGNANAFSALFGLWGHVFDADGDAACQQAIRLKLRCLADSSALAALLVLDRPAIVTLRTEDGEAHQVVLARVEDQSLTLLAGDAELQVDTGQLARYWFGDYLLLWQPPNDDVQNLRPGMRGLGVVWLRQSLTAILGVNIPPVDSDRFDETLAAQVRDYQRRRRLTVDGLVGQRTQIMINSDLGLAGVPRLTERDVARTTLAAETN